MTHTLTHGGGGLTPDEKLLQKQRVKAIKSSLANHHTLSKPSSAAPNKPPSAPHPRPSFAFPSPVTSVITRPSAKLWAAVFMSCA